MTESNTDNLPPAAGEPGESKKESRSLVWLTLLIAAAGIAWALIWFFYLRFHETTDDAYANGNFITINPVVEGYVISWYADDTDFVNEGFLLARLDPTKYGIIYEQELASLKSTVLQVRQLFNQLQANLALVENKRIVSEKAHYDYENRLKLVDSLAISNEEFIHARDTLKIAEYDLEQAKFLYQVSVDAIGNIQAGLEKHPVIEQQKGRVKIAYYNLKHCSIFAPSSGYVAQRSVDVGQWVTPTTPLMSLIPTDYVWVDANFKETQLRDMRIGQPSTVTFDLYGSDVVYQGRVLGIAMGSGSVFSLIPPQNATGNWIKIVQRLPVRISLDPEILKDFPVRLGISAEVDVDITDKSYPLLATSPPVKPLAVTRVYDIDLHEVDSVMDALIKENLK